MIGYRPSVAQLKECVIGLQKRKVKTVFLQNNLNSGPQRNIPSVSSTGILC